MKIRTSYFYQIRNFKKNMIPVSTAMSDPLWYRPEQGQEYFFDKRGIVNGLRYTPLIVQGGFECGCPCETRQYGSCSFLKDYAQALNTVDFDKMLKAFEYCGNKFVKDDEPIIVLMVYEVPSNYCSERIALQNLFQQHGIECKELGYPIAAAG